MKTFDDRSEVMTAVLNRSRQPKGSPVGGEFAAEAGVEADVELGAPAPETPFTVRYDTMQEKLAAFHGELESAVERLQDDDEWLNYMRVMSSFHNYSMNNQLLIWVQNPEATRVAGFRKWQDLDRHVDKGQKGLQILAPCLRVFDAEQGDLGAFFDNKSKRWKRRGAVGFTTASVFDVSQTSGTDLPEGRKSVTGEPPEGFITDLESAIVDQGFTVIYSDDLGSANGSTSGTNKTVRVASHLSPADRASTLAHELGHIGAGHLDHLSDYHCGRGGKRDVMEVEAESISYVMCRANGMDPDAVGGHHDRYISGWGGIETAPEKVRASAETVSKTVKTLLAGRTWSNAV